MHDSPHEPPALPVEEEPSEATRPAYLKAVQPLTEAEHARKDSSKKVKPPDDFFDQAEPHSVLKAQIVAKYFVPWARIMKSKAPDKRMAYIDLYSGPGVYKDGTESTPMKIMRSILDDPELRNMVLPFFADENEGCVSALRANFAGLPEIEMMKFAPQVVLGAANEHGLIEHFKTRGMVPTFMFLDPFGYNGLSTELMRTILRNFGSEIVFFFKYSRIHAAIHNPLVRAQMDELFGHDGVDSLKALLPTLVTQSAKEQAILAGLKSSLAGIGGRRVLIFRFRNASGRVTHHLVFVTKNDLAYNIMKGIMANASTDKIQDVATFEYRPNSAANASIELPLFGAGHGPIDMLKAELLDRYRGRRLSIEEIFRDHSYDTPFVEKNYSEAFRQLAYEDGKVSAERGPMSPKLNPNSRWPMPFTNTFITFDKA